MCLVLMLELTLICAKSQPSGMMRLQNVLNSPNLTLILWSWARGRGRGVTKIKVTYNLVFLMGIPVVCMTCTYYAPFGSDAQIKLNRTCFVYIDGALHIFSETPELLVDKMIVTVVNFSLFTFIMMMMMMMIIIF